MDDYFRVVVTLLGPLPPESYLDARKGLRTLADFSLTQSFGLKAFQKRSVTFGHLSMHPTPVGSVLSVETGGVSVATKYTGALRHRYVEGCPHFALAAYLFSRFHIADDYGAIELKNIELNRYNIADIMLLWGNNKFQSISYSQQHNSATSALYTAGVKGMPPSSDNKPTASAVEHLDLAHLVEHAGFSSVADYHIVRDEVPPPPEVVSQIFTFVDTENNIGTVRAQFHHLCRQLRVSLVQDMALIRNRYPHSPLSRHPLFQSKQFDDYCDKVWALDPPQYRLATFSSPIPMPSDVHSLQEQLRQAHDQLVHMSHDFDSFVLRQRQQYAHQVHYLQQLRNVCHGCYLLTYNFYSHNQLILIQQNLSNASHLIETNLHISQEIMENQGVLGMMADSIKATAASLALPEDPVSSPSYPSDDDTHAWRKEVIKTLSPVVSPQSALRSAVLNRRLSRQATTLYEMWNDFKDVERGLAAHNITVTEWLKVHGSSERQFRHTRHKIIKFIEEEAMRRQTSVDVIKDMLHRKMISGDRPMSLDQLQRMLTSGRRIDLN